MTSYGSSDASESSIGGNAQGDFSGSPSGPSMTARPGDAPVNTNIVTNAYGDFVRGPGSGPSLAERPGYAPVNPGISSNAHGDFGRVPPRPSMTERPGYATVNTGISSNAHGDFGRVPPGQSMTERPSYAHVNIGISSNAHGDFGRVPPRENNSSVPATSTNNWAHQQQPTTGGPYRPQGHIKPDGPKCFQIFVNNFSDSKNYTFEVKATETVEQLKVKIEAKLGIAQQQQRLTYAGKNLEDSMKLSHYGICEHSTVHLTARLRGG